MHEISCLAGKNVSWKMPVEACPVDGFGTASAMLRSWPDRPCSGTDMN